MLIGGMKCGSSTLYKYLERHPGIFMCYPKEPQFFSRDHVYGKGMAWYLQLFDNARSGQLCGEASACYTNLTHYPKTPERIYAEFPDIKLIYIMRHPVDRAYSQYIHNMNYEWPNADFSFAEAVEQDLSILESGRYFTIIQEYMRYFSREQILFLKFEELISNPKAVTDMVQRFLGVSYEDLYQGQGLHLNAGGGEVLTKRRLKNFVRKIRHWPVLNRAVDLIPKSARRKLFESTVDTLLNSSVGKKMKEKEKQRYEKLSSNKRNELLDYFQEDTRMLQNFLGQDLSAWTR